MLEIVYAHIAVITGAILLDITLGDPRNRYHPTAWVGHIIALLIPLYRGRTWGATVCVISCTITGVPAILLHHIVWSHSQHAEIIIIYCIAAIILLKSTIAIRGLQVHAVSIITRLESGQTQAAAHSLAHIVKRPTNDMNSETICSATIESIAENTTDSVTGPLFYMGWFGLPGAFMYRTINTIDAMVGYKTPSLARVGWFGAHSDTILNWIPARITACIMVLAAAILKHDYNGAIRAIRNDSRKPSSRNSGYTMAAMAGALGVRLRKVNHYTIGMGREPGINDVHSALKIAKCTSCIFAIMIVIPATYGACILWEMIT